MVEQFNAEMPHAEARQPGSVLRQTLGLGMKYRVTAIGIDQNRMFASFPIAEPCFFV